MTASGGDDVSRHVLLKTDRARAEIRGITRGMLYAVNDVDIPRVYRGGSAYVKLKKKGEGRRKMRKKNVVLTIPRCATRAFDTLLPLGMYIDLKIMRAIMA